MAKYKSINDYRRKQKLKSFLKTFLVLLIIAGVLFVVSSVFQLFNGTKINTILGDNIDIEMGSFPIIIKDEQLIDLYSLGNGLTVLSKGNLLNYSSSGKRGLKSSHGYTNPVVEEGNKRILTYDRGGNNFRVDTNSDFVGEKRLTNQIISAQIAPNGNVAVVTTHNQYSSIVTVYDDKLTEIYKYSSGDRISLVSFSQDSKNIAATSIITQNGILSAAILELNITENTPAKKIIIEGIFPLETTYSLESELTIIGSSEVVTYNTKTSDFKRYEFKGDLIKFSSSTINQTILVNENALDGTSNITLIGADGVTVSQYNVKDTVKDIYSDGHRLTALGVKAAYNFDMSLNLLNEIDLDKPYNKIIHNGQQIYLLGMDCVARFDIE